MSRSDIRSLVDETPAPELPQLIGELEAAIEMGFDMVVGPDSGMGGCKEPIEFVKMVGMG